MKRIVEFIKTSVIGGFFVILPVALILFLLVELAEIVILITEPVTEHLPIETLGGIEVATLVAIVLILGACFVTGLAMRTQIGVRFGELVERFGLNRLPGYTLLKSLTQSFSGVQDGSAFAVAVATIRDSDVLGFIIEEHDNGDFTVFVPAAPTPTIGTVYCLKPEKVRKLDVPMSEAVNCIMQWGIGSKALFAQPS